MSRGPLFAAGVAVVALSATIASGRTGPLQVDDVRCLRGCAGPRTAAVGSVVRFHGRRLGRVNEVRFAAEVGTVSAPVLSTGRRVVRAEVPDGAASGRPRLRRPDGEGDRSPTTLRVVPGGQLPPPGTFELEGARLRPDDAFFDDRRPLRVIYRFTAFGPRNVKVRLVRRPGGEVMRTLEVGRAAPYKTHTQRWNGLDGGGGVPPDGRYAVRVEPAGGGGARGQAFRFHGHRFPVRGPHSYGGALQRFGAPRSGGRTHEGQDVYAACGTRLEAARGGRVQARGYHAALYGNYVVIDGRGTRADHLYAHLRSPSPARGRVKTGERVGDVGRTGNARTTPCHLHFEIWPQGRGNGSAIDPLPALRRWDGWS